MTENEKSQPKKASSALDKFKIENVLSEVSNYVHDTLPHGQERLAKFEIEFKKKFPKGNVGRAGAEALTWALLDSPLAAFFLGLNSAVFVELHGLLERYVLRDMSSLLARNKTAAEIISSLIERKTLGELAEVLLKLKVWNDEDIRFARKLVNIRNGIVHKNTKLLSRHLSPGKNITLLGIEEVVNKTDVIPFILGTTELLWKLSQAARRAKANQGRNAS